MKKGIIISAILIAFISIIIGSMWVSAHNGEIQKREQVIAQQQTCEANFDKMFKTITQVAEVSERNMEQAREAFKEIYIPLMEGRYSNDRAGALMSWVKEHNPEFDLQATSELYKNLQRVIESNRESFFLEQKKLISNKQEHEKFIKTFPNKLFLNVNSIEITVITSEETDKAYETGQENDINLF